MQEHRLSKSSFLRGIRCPKSLYLDLHRTDQRDPLPVGAVRRMQEGQEVHRLAQTRFPGGVYASIPAPLDIPGALARTQNMIDAGETTLYEAAFSADGVVCFIDLLQHDGSGWNLYEVKSTTSYKGHQLWDIALQVYVLLKAGLVLHEANLLHLNSDYSRSGELDVEELFAVEPLMPMVEGVLDDVREGIRHCLQTIDSSSQPEIDIGPYCDDPDPCDFKGYCWEHIPSPSVFDVFRLQRQKKFELYSQGVVRIEDIPDEFPMGASSAFHVDAHKQARKIIDRAAIQEFLEGLVYPLNFLDFESYTTAIPPFDGLSPHGQIPFQYSLHIQKDPDGELSHFEYLADAGVDPRAALLDRLLRDMSEAGDIITYNMSFEKMILNRLRDQIPGYEEEIAVLLGRIKDLMKPFQNRHYYVPEMNGSASLKSVLPVLVPEMGYEELAISDGTSAMESFLSLTDISDLVEADKVRKALLDYCAQDTLAMVRILEVLQRSVA